jgi:hypothetical protein
VGAKRGSWQVGCGVEVFLTQLYVALDPKIQLRSEFFSQTAPTPTTHRRSTSKNPQTPWILWSTSGGAPQLQVL